MSEEADKKLDFSLPERPAPKRPSGSGPSLLLVLLILLVGANLYLTWSKGGGIPTTEHTTRELEPESVKQLALKMEKQGLSEAAAGMWVEYLESPETDEGEAAAIWYRIGTLHQDADAHEAALAAFYRSEAIDGDGDLSSEIGRRVQQSLEALGKFAALKHELAGRVGLDDDAGAAGGKVVAEIGPRKITRVELDRQIEVGIENQLAMFAGQLPDEQRKQQKEAMLKQLANDQQRMQFLNQFIVQEILYRKARESKLLEDPAVRAQLRDAERSLLARQFMETELSGKINITDGDLNTWYEANKAKYVDPASAQLSHIVVADEEGAKAVIAEIMAGAEFAELAKGRSLDAATKGKGGEIAAPAVRGQALAGLSVPPEALSAVFEAKAGDILDTPVKSEAGYHVIRVRDTKAERQKPFDEVRAAIYREIRETKEREVQAQLLEELRDEYDVVIHQDAFASPPPTK
jgi:parvulin-like peptidyl-prolyl isomerase